MAEEDRRSGQVVDVAFGTTTVTVTAPTVAEVNALTRIEDEIVDTVSTPRTGSGVAVHAASALETAMIAGLITNGMYTLNLWRNFDGTDATWTLFDDTVTPKATANLVVCRAGFSGTGTPPVADAGDIIDIFRVQIASRAEEDYGNTGSEGDGQRFNVELTLVKAYRSVAVVA